LCVFSQKTEEERSWNQPVEPFNIIGNIYYVGASDVTAYLITTPKGHILIDSGFFETVPQIKQNITKLGFKLEDVKILLNSHAHYDHAGGLAELKRLTRAKLLASRDDARLLAMGGKGDPNFEDRFPFEPVTADGLLTDGTKVKLGGEVLTANITPGHTKGCTTWTTTAAENGRKHNVIFVCSTTAPGYKLVDNAGYPGIATDYEYTFERLKKMKVDVFLASHGNFYNLEEKSARKRKGESPNPFIDPSGYKKFLNETEATFLAKLRDQQKSSK
jgi:metallo-beta-lactamase class B